MEKQMIATTLDNKTFTFTGTAVESIRQYFKNGNSLPLGWVMAGDIAVNFNHVVHVEFREV